jgi:hypothetical protein
MTVEPETRRYPRRNVHKEMLVAWKKGSQKYVSRAENLGLGGLFISTQQPPPVGTSLQLLFNVPEGEVRGRAIVRNLASSRGMGLAIVSMEQEHRARLDRWLKRLAAEAEPVTSHG